MLNKKTHKVLICAITLLFLLQTALPAQTQHTKDQEPDDTRRLWNEQYLEQRPAVTAHRTARKNPVPKNLIGVTLWKLRQASTTERRQTRILVPGGSQAPTVKLIAERVTADSVFQEGDLVRISIEIPRSGFLYVIDREEYENGSLGVPYLIFPANQIRNGDNSVRAGKLVEIPDIGGDPPYLTVKRTGPAGKHQTAERLSIIVSPTRLDLPLGDGLVQLDGEQVAKWERDWGGQTERRESANGAGKRQTAGEHLAGEGKRILAPGDPLPQTIFKIVTKEDQAILLTLPIKIVSKQ